MSDTEYYFNTKTQQVEVGPQSDWQNRLGPYKTYADAAAALQRAKERNEEWEEQDAEWRESWQDDGGATPGGPQQGKDGGGGSW